MLCYVTHYIDILINACVFNTVDVLHVFTHSIPSGPAHIHTDNNKENVQFAIQSNHDYLSYTLKALFET